MWIDVLIAWSQWAPEFVASLCGEAWYGFQWFLSMVEPQALHALVFYCVHGYWPV